MHTKDIFAYQARDRKPSNGLRLLDCDSCSEECDSLSMLSLTLFNINKLSKYFDG
jgi:hypothetical protein